MSDEVVFKSLPSEQGWKVTRNDKLVTHYPNQRISEEAAARLARAEAKKGNKAVTIMHKANGTVARQHSYTKLKTPWLRR